MPSKSGKCRMNKALACASGWQAHAPDPLHACWVQVLELVPESSKTTYQLLPLEVLCMRLLSCLSHNPPVQKEHLVQGAPNVVAVAKKCKGCTLEVLMLRSSDLKHCTWYLLCISCKHHHTPDHTHDAEKCYWRACCMSGKALYVQISNLPCMACWIGETSAASD